MSRKRRKSSSPVQLFPFLAVLVSTMGALILLLLAFNRQATEQAIAAAVGLLAQRTNDEEASLAQRRQDLLADLASLRDRLADARRDEQHVDRALVEADGRRRADQSRADAVRRDLTEIRTARTRSETEIAALRQQIAALEAAKARAATQQQPNAREFVPVVHPGANGTSRKPIYIECTADAVMLQPEQIAIPLTALANGAAAEAFAGAIRALAAHYQERERPASQDAQPYPLLLVRPNGIGAYYAARQAIEELDLPFGYELIEADWTLRFPEPDAQARAVALAALARRSRGTDGGSFATRRGMGRAGTTPLGHDDGTPRGHDAAAAAEPVGCGGLTDLTSLRSPFARGPETAPAGPREVPHGGGSNANRSPGREAGFQPVVAKRQPSPPDKASENPSKAQLDESKASERPAGEMVAELVAPTTAQDNTQRDSNANRDASWRADVRGNSASTRVTPEQREPPKRQPTDVARRTHPRSASDDENGDEAADSGSQRTRPLPGNPRSGRIAVPRKIHVRCLPDSIVIGPRELVVPIPLTGPLDEVVSRLLDELEQEIVNWGPAGITFRWQPQLVFDVSSDALNTYFRLRFALAGSSIPMEHNLSADADEILSEARYLKDRRFTHGAPEYEPLSSIFDPRPSGSRLSTHDSRLSPE
jgi:hypothetical protein